MIGTSWPNDLRAIEIEAASWIAQLNGDHFSEADRVALKEWCGRSPAHFQTIQRQARIWQELDVLASLRNDFVALQPKSGPQGRIRWTGFWLGHAAVAAIAMVTLGTWLYGWQRTDERAPIEYFSTDIGEQTTVTLRDRSTIRLNTASFVEVDYGVDDRRVRLVKGEALFDIESSPDRPFVVDAGTTTLRAVGTQFAVRVHRDGVSVIVNEGKVVLGRSGTRSAASAGGSVGPMLGRGQAATLGDVPGQSIEVESLDDEELERRLSWSTGILDFQGETLEEVIAEVSRYTPLQIEIAQRQLRELPVAGRFRVGDVETLFAVIEAGLGAEIKRNGDRVIITTD